MKKIILVLSLMPFLLFNSCELTNEKVKIGFLFGDFFAPRWEKEAAFFKERIEQLGGEVLIADAGGNDLKQHEQAKEFIEKGVDVLVITIVNANTAASIVRMAHNNNIKVIAYDGLILNAELDYFVGFDLEKVGEEQAKYIIEKKPTGNYVLFNGDKSHAAAIDVNKGTKNVLQQYIDSKKINLVYEGWMENWSGENAKYYMDKVHEFSDTKIDAVIAASDGIAAGVYQELKKRGLESDVLITGQDGELSACNRIYYGKQAMTVYKPSKKIAVAAAELANKVAKKESIIDLKYKFNGRVEVPSVIIPPIVLDSLRLGSTVIADGTYTLEQIKNYSTD